MWPKWKTSTFSNYTKKLAFAFSFDTLWLHVRNIDVGCFLFFYDYGFTNFYTIVAQEHSKLDALRVQTPLSSATNQPQDISLEKTMPYPFHQGHSNIVQNMLDPSILYNMVWYTSVSEYAVHVFSYEAVRYLKFNFVMK